MQFRDQQGGIGLLELCLALSVIAVMTLMVLRYYREVHDTQIMVRMQKNTSTVMDAGKHWWLAHGNFNGMSVGALQAYGLLAQDWQGNAWGGSAQLHTALQGRSLQWVLTAVPLKQCHRWLAQQKGLWYQARCESFGDLAIWVGVFQPEDVQA